MQTISRDALKPGMFVVSHGKGTFDSPLVQVQKCLPSLASINAFVPQDAGEVLVDPERSHFVRESSLAEETSAAKVLYAKAMSHVRSFVDEVRRGKDIDFRESAPLVDSFIESVFRNEAAAATLFKLRLFDEYTYTHCINVSILSVILGKHQGLDRDALRELGMAGIFHDIGKARIPETILNKPGKLSESEFAVMKSHPMEGFRLMEGKPSVTADMLRAVLEHHERQDGTGYPRGLKGPDISPFARIISVVDVYDALTSRRVYKEPMAPAKALGLMYQWRDRDFSPLAIERFIKCLGVFPLGSLVRLSGGEHAIVVGTNAEHPTRPQVKAVFDARLRPQRARVLDLAALAGTPEAQDIVEVLNPADHNLDLEPFFLS
jgi:HD-GYP domain-containing protein (c-di-GMP phosphodiesterase class II)